jgi:hypothetical protein
MCERVRSGSISTALQFTPTRTNPKQNYRTYCAMNDIAIDTSLVEGSAANNDADEDMDIQDGNAENGDENDGMEVDDDGNVATNDVDNEAQDDDDTPSFFKELAAASAAKEVAKTPSKRPKTKVAALVREKIRHVLEDVTGLAEKRARTLGENEFLHLLLSTSRCFLFFFLVIEKGLKYLLVNGKIADKLVLLGFHKEGIHFS